MVTLAKHRLIGFMLLALASSPLVVAQSPGRQIPVLLSELEVDFANLRQMEDKFPLQPAYDLVARMQDKCDEADLAFQSAGLASRQDIVRIHTILKMAAAIIDYRGLYDLHDQIILQHLNTRRGLDSYLSGPIRELHEKYRRQMFPGDLKAYRLEIDRSTHLVPLRDIVIRVAGSERSGTIAARKFAESLTLQFRNPIVTNEYIKFFLQDAQDVGLSITPTDYFSIPDSAPRKREWSRAKAAELQARRYLELGCGVPPGPCYIPAGKYSIFVGPAGENPAPNMFVPDTLNTDLEGFRWRIHPSGYADVDEMRTTRIYGLDRFRPEFKLLRFDLGANRETSQLEGTVELRMFHKFGKSFALQTQLEGAFRSHRDNVDLFEAVRDLNENEARRVGFVDRGNRPLADFSSNEIQFDIGPVIRVGSLQFSAMHSLRWVDRDGWDSAGTVGHFFFNVGYLFNRGQVGGFFTKASLDEPIVRSVQFDEALFEETFLKVVDQVGVNFNVSVTERSSIEGAFGYLNRFNADNAPGGVVRFNFPPVARRFKITAEFGYNESFVAFDNSWRFGVGLRFGEWGKDNSPAKFASHDGPVPVYVPRVRYETLTRVVRRGNQRPLADAGADQLDLIPFGILPDGRRGTRVVLDGTNSVDPDGDTISFQWTRLEDCPTTVILENATSATPSLLIGNGERCSVQLIVTDSLGLESEPDVVLVSTRAVQQPTVVRFTATPSDIRLGQSSTIEWEIQNAETLTITNLPDVGVPGGDGTTSDLPTGSRTVSPGDNTTYALTACNLVNECANAQLTVRVQPQIPVIDFFRADPPEIRQGECSTLGWRVTNAASVRIDNLNQLCPGENLPSALPLEGTLRVAPIDNATFTLTATNDRGEFTSAEATVTVRPAAPVVEFFQAVPSSIRDGDCSTLRWRVADAFSIQISNLATLCLGENAPPSPLPLEGSIRVAPNQNTTYVLTADNNRGDVVSAEATVTVTAPLPGLEFFEANPAEVRRGECSTLSWSASGGQVTIDNLARLCVGETLPSPLPTVGSVRVMPDDTRTYTLTVTNASDESLSSQATVVVRPAIPEILSFSAIPSQIGPGQCSRLAWQVENAERVEIDNLVLCEGQVLPSPLPSNGSILVMPSDTTTYTLSATNDRGEFARAETTVEVRPDLPEILFFRAIPPTIRRGSPNPASQLQWRTENSVSVTITNVPGFPVLAPEGHVDVMPAVTTVYVLVARNAAGQTATASVTVEVLDALPTARILEFEAAPTSITIGASSTLSWTTQDAAFVRILFNGQVTAQLPANGSLSVTPSQTTTYTMRAFNSAGETGELAAVTVTVTP